MTNRVMFGETLMRPSISRHLVHLEDVLWEYPADGLAFLQHLGRACERTITAPYLSPAVDIAIKVDGSPSVVFGPRPSDGRFCVSTKAAFNRSPKLPTTHGEIDQLFTSDVRPVLHVLLDELPKLAPSRMLQGDVLYTSGPTIQEIEGQTYCVFQPNTLMYAVDAASPVGNRMSQSRVGLALHTMFDGSGSVPITPDVVASLHSLSDVVLVDTRYTRTEARESSPDDESDYQLLLASLDEEVASASTLMPVMQHVQMCHDELSAFINTRVRQGLTLTDVPQLMDDWEVFCAQQLQGDTQDAVMATFYQNAAEWSAWWTIFATVGHMKRILLRAWADTAPWRVLVSTPLGWRLTGPEGYVVHSRQWGRTVKCVDRLVFSQANFLAHPK